MIILKNKKYLYGFLIYILSLISGSAYADDTEIYFSSGTQTQVEIKPNILFILDTSGSMGTLINDSLVTGKGENKLSRMETLKKAITNILNDIDDVNVGLMRFTAREGGSVIFPVTDIDSDVKNVVSEGATRDNSSTYTITNSNNDAAEYLSDGSVDLNGDILIVNNSTPYNRNLDIDIEANNIFHQGTSGKTTSPGINDEITLESDEFVGLKIDSVKVPQEADIIEAYIEVSESLSSTKFNIAVVGANSLNVGDNALSTLLKTDSESFPFRTRVIKKIYVTNQLKNLVYATTWTQGNSVSFLLSDKEGTGTVKLKSATDTPKLKIQWKPSSKNTSKTINGLRFDNIQIPSDAEITSAKFTYNTPNTNNTPVNNLKMSAEESSNSKEFTANKENLSSRSRSNAMSLPVKVQNKEVTVTGVEALIKPIINDSNWCTSNAISLFIEDDSGYDVYSYEKGQGLEPTLTIEYKLPVNSSSCQQKTIVSQILKSEDDAVNWKDNNDYQTLVNTLNLTIKGGGKDKNKERVGLRFSKLGVPKKAMIEEAFITFKANLKSTETRVEIYGNKPKTPDLAEYTEPFKYIRTDAEGKPDPKLKSLYNKEKTTTSVEWKTKNWKVNRDYKTADIKEIVQEIVNDDSWDERKAMTFIFKKLGGNDLQAYSFDSDALRAPTIEITYKDHLSTSPIKTVRKRLIELVSELKPAEQEGGTPIPEVVYEAARYWRGDEVNYAKNLGAKGILSPSAKLAHPATYCTAPNSCDGAETSNHPPYGVEESQTLIREIKGTPEYISPITKDYSCASNYQVLLSDGEPTDLQDASIKAIEKYIGDGISCGNRPNNANERCTTELAEFLADKDVNEDIKEDQNVITHTIGFALEGNKDTTKFLLDVAKAGKGEAYEGSSGSTLIDIFKAITSEVASAPSSLGNPSLAINAFNTLYNRNDVYLPIFSPNFKSSWKGNLKKYKVCVEEDIDGNGTKDCTLGQVIDQNNKSIVDSITGKVADNVKSFWSNNTDGPDVTKGGAGAEFVNHKKRVVYTDVAIKGTHPIPLSTSGYKITAKNWSEDELGEVRDVICKNPADNKSDKCKDIVLWMLGKTSPGDLATDINKNNRWVINDVIHSSPVIITYGGKDDNNDSIIDTYYDRAIYGSNDGALRFINGNTGKEEWSFIPKTLLEKQNKIRNTLDVAGDHIYGMDLTPKVKIVDNNNDGNIKINDNDSVTVFAGMRRGGKSIYALDLTADIKKDADNVVPKFLWRIDSNTKGFERLGQTWSQLELGEILTAEGAKDIIAFGGGYDEYLDENFGLDGTVPNIGNMIFIVDQETGKKIFSIGGEDSNADIEVPNMNYAIPSDVSLIDTDGDGYDDRLYVGDTGGQLWRVDIANDVDSTTNKPQGSTVVGRLAHISTEGELENQRRFFEPPAVAQIRDSKYSTIAEYDYITIGSGNRANPLDTTTNDRMYAFRDYTIGKMTADSSNKNLATNYPSRPSLSSSDTGPISHENQNEIIDVTSSVLDETDPNVVDSLGWYLDFLSGEKVLSKSIIRAGKLLFNTYVPKSTADICKANIGISYGYVLNILNGNAAMDWDADGNINHTEKYVVLGAGIASDLITIFTNDGVRILAGSDGGIKDLGKIIEDSRNRSYWFEE